MRKVHATGFGCGSRSREVKLKYVQRIPKRTELIFIAQNLKL